MQNVSEGRAPRQSNIELLRIVAMLMIVGHHFSIYGGFDFPVDSISVNRLWVQFIQIGGKIGVDVFILISGYFSVTAKSFRTAKAIKLWWQVLFYSIVIFTVFVALGAEPFSARGLIHHLAPITFGQWWFVSAFFLLLLLSPYINRLLQSFDRRQYVGFLALLGICWCIIPTVTGQTYLLNDLLWFGFLYCLAGYLRLFNIQTKLSGVKLIGLAFLCILLTFSSVVVFDILGISNTFFLEHNTYFYDMQTLPILVISVLLLLGFSKLKLGSHKSINVIASASFGVYLIHDNWNIRNVLWGPLFHTADYADSAFLIPYSLFVIAAVYIGCTLVELARIYLLEKCYGRGMEQFAAFIDRTKDSILSKIAG